MTTLPQESEAAGQRWHAAALATARRAVARLLPVLVELTSHHGVWSPGVKVLRNVGLRKKAAVVVACVVLPMAVALTLLLQDVVAGRAQSQRLQTGVDSLQRLAALTHATGAVRSAAAGAGPQRPIGQLLDGERQAFAAFAAAVDGNTLGPGVQHATDAVLARRKTVLDASASASSVERNRALGEYIRDLVLLSTDIARGSGMSSHADPGVRTLQELATVWLPKLGLVIGRSLALGPAQMEHADDQRRDQRLTEAVVESRLLLALLQPPLEYAEAAGLADGVAVNAPIQAIGRYVEMLAADSRAGGDGGTGGVSAGEFTSQARQALDAAEALHIQTLTALSRQVNMLAAEQRIAVGWRALLLAGWLLLTVYLMVCTYKVVGGGMNTLCGQLERMGRGDLGIRPRGLGKDEVGRALTTLGASAARMSQLFEAVTQGVSAVAHASREVATGNAGLSERTSEIGALIVQVSEKAQEFSGSMDRCGHEVELAANLIQEMRHDAKRGRKAMAGLRERMSALQGKSREITQVVRLVEAVAYQTKMLSINASVEAARAGPAGRGFAVVAHEVRALAQRSEAAAQRIGVIVGASIDEIEGGGRMTERADEAVRHTDERSDALNGLMQLVVELTRSGRSQSQQVLEIARNVEDSVAGNGRVINQLAQASAALRVQGDSLKRSTQHFIFH